MTTRHPRRPSYWVLLIVRLRSATTHRQFPGGSVSIHGEALPAQVSSLLWLVRHYTKGLIYVGLLTKVQVKAAVAAADKAAARGQTVFQENHGIGVNTKTISAIIQAVEARGWKLDQATGFSNRQLLFRRTESQ